MPSESESDVESVLRARASRRAREVFCRGDTALWDALVEAFVRLLRAGQEMP